MQWAMYGQELGIVGQMPVGFACKPVYARSFQRAVCLWADAPNATGAMATAFPQSQRSLDQLIGNLSCENTANFRK